MHMIQVVFLTVLVFFTIVTIHEWGHFIFAKRAGILVREFAIGFGPKLLSLKRGETKYTLRLIPAGGYVRMAGEDPEIVEVQPGQTVAVRVKADKVTAIYLDRLDERSNVMRGEVEALDLEKDLFITLLIDGESETFELERDAFIIARGNDTQIAPLDRQFGGKSLPKRVMTIFAGPMMNFILAFILFGTYVQMAGIPEKVLINEISAGMPAAESSIKANDIVEAVNGQKIGADFNKMIELIGASAGVPVVFDIIRNGERVQVKITPKADEEGVGKIGVTSKYATRSATALETVQRSGILMKDMTIHIFNSLKMLVTAQFKLDDLAGPVKTAEMTSQIARQGITQLTLWTALLSLYLGIFNLLPIPALDGSRLLFLGIEAVRRRPVDSAKESMVHFVGFVMLMLLMLVVTYNDILRLVKGE